MAGSILIPMKSVFDDKGVKEAQNSFSKLGSSMKGIIGALGVGIGIAAITNGLKESAKAAIEDTKSQALLANQLRNTIGATDGQIASVESSIRAMQMQASVADDVIRPAFASLVRSTGDVAQATALTSLALDVAAGTGKDLGAVSLALGKAVNGSTTALVKLVPSIKGASDPMGELAKQFDGAAEAAANNDPIQRMNIIMGELQETIGMALLPYLEDFANYMASDSGAQDIQDFADAIIEVADAVKTLTPLIGDLFAGFKTVPYAFSQLLSNPGEFFKIMGMNTADALKYINSKQADQSRLDPALSRLLAGQTSTVSGSLGGGTSGGSSSGGAAKKAATNYVAEFATAIADEARKSRVKIALAGKGLSDGLIESIVGSGKGWLSVATSIMRGSDAAADSLQKKFNQTAAGIDEIAKATQDAADVAAKAAEDLKAANEALLADLNDQLAATQTRLDELTSTLTPAAKTVIEIYNEAKQAYDSLVESSGNFAKTIPDLVAGIKSMTQLADPIGQFESQLVSSFGNIESSLKSALDSKVITDASYRDLSAWAKREMALMQDVARQRDELAKKISLAEAVYDSSKNAILAYGNINGLIKTTTSTVVQTQTQLVNGFATTLQKSVELISKTNIVDEYKNILAKTKEFAANLNALKKLGLNKDLFKQIVDAGVDAGGATAQGILEGGQQSVVELNDIFTELNQVGNDVAETTTVVMFNNGVDVLGGFIEGMKAQATALADTATGLANSFAEAFGIALKSALQIAIDDAKAAFASAKAALQAEIDAVKAELARIQGEINKVAEPVVVPVVAVPVVSGVDAGPSGGWQVGQVGFKGGTSLVDGGTTVNLTVNAGLGTNGAQLGGQIVELIKKYEKTSGAVFV